MAFKSMAYLNFYEEFMADDNMKKVRNYARKGMLREGVGLFGSTVYFHPPIYREEYLSEYDYDHSYTTNGKLVLVADSITWQKNFDYNTQFFNYMDTTSIANVRQYLRFMQSGGRTAQAVFYLIPKAYLGQVSFNRLIHFMLAGVHSVNAASVGHVVIDGHGERARALGHQTYVSAQLNQVLVIGSNYILTVYEYAAFYGKAVNVFGQTVQAAQQGALAAARRTYYTGDLVDRERDVYVL